MTTTSYDPMTCRVCGATIAADPLTPAIAPKSLASCKYRCSCGAAYSNNRDPGKRTLIWPTPEQNVPREVADGLQDVLANAANIRNRKMKRWKFAFETSEDAVTWTVVRALADIGRLDAIRDDRRNAGPPAVLLWGVPVQGATAETVAATLKGVSIALGETPSARSEPDVILAWPDRVLVVEAKYGSRNDVKPGYKGFPLYLTQPDLFAVDASQLITAGFYELTRNWRIGAGLAQRLNRQFTLVNLGREEAAVSADQFSALLAQKPGRTFRFLTWAELLDRAAQSRPLPGWLEGYAEKRCLGA
jgi:hypothetical protein